jgi:hypothetical protein
MKYENICNPIYFVKKFVLNNKTPLLFQVIGNHTSDLLFFIKNGCLFYTFVESEKELKNIRNDITRMSNENFRYDLIELEQDDC